MSRHYGQAHERDHTRTATQSFVDRLQSQAGRRPDYESGIGFATADRDASGLGRIDASRPGKADKLFDRVRVSEAFIRLLPSQREVIRKAYYLGLTTGQIADELNLTEAVVKSRLHHGLHTLQLTLIDPTMRTP